MKKPTDNKIEEGKNILRRIDYFGEELRQRFPQPLDDEGLREKAQKLKGMIKGITTLSSDREKWAEMFEMIDQILALLQLKIEEAYKKGRYDALEDNTKEMMEFAKREERERIQDVLTNYGISITNEGILAPYSDEWDYLYDTPRRVLLRGNDKGASAKALWQALKRGE